MDPASAPLDRQGSTERNISPDASSTRPNPFDDADASSRKRRRTSASASLSPATVTPVDIAVADQTGSSILKQEEAGQYEDSSTLGMSKAKPTAPEHDTDACAEKASNDPPSSQITINIRQRPNGECLEASGEYPASSQHEIKEEVIEQITEAEEVRWTVLGELMAVNVGQGAAPAASTPNDDLSGPGYLEEVDHDAMVRLSPDGYFPAADTFIDLVEITDQFPFREPGSDLLETFQRVKAYISSQSVLNNALVVQLSDWIKLCVQYLDAADPQDVLLSLRSQASFWSAFPDIAIAFKGRIPSIAGSWDPSIRIIDLLSAFARLARHFVKLDLHTLSLRRSNQNPETTTAVLFCTEYLYQLHELYQIGDLIVQNEDTMVTEKSTIWNRRNMVRAFLIPLETRLGNLIDWAETYVSELIKFVMESKSHIPTLAAVSQVLADCLSESSKRLQTPSVKPMVRSRIEDTLRRGSDVWSATTEVFLVLVDNHTSLLNVETTFELLQSLTSMRISCCRPDSASQYLSLGQPDSAADVLGDLSAWIFRLEIFAKLIQCSQMQLRVKAVHTLCSDLIQTWKRLNAMQSSEASEFLLNLGQSLDKHLVDYVIDARCHPEIIIESANIIGFLVVSKAYSEQHTDRLWTAIVSSQDPRVSDALTRMMLTVCNLLDYDTLLQLCDKFQQLPIDSFSSPLRSLWENVLKELIAKRQGSELPLTRHPFLCCLRILRESSQLDTSAKAAHMELHQTAIQKLKELLIYGIDPTVRRDLYEDCVEDLKSQSEKTLGSLWFLSMSTRPGIATEVEYLIEEHDFAQLLVGDIERAVQSSTANRPVLSGHTNYPRRDLLYNIIQRQPAAVSGSLSTKLWDLLVGCRSKNADDRTAAWQLMATVGRSSEYQNIFLQTCFTNFLSKLPAEYYCEGMLEIVKDNVFQLVNDPSGSVLDDEKLVSTSAIEQLWRVILVAEDDHIVMPAIRMLASNVYLESRAIASCPTQKAQQIHIGLADRCLQSMQNAAQKLKRISDGSPSGDDESMVFVASEEDVRLQEKAFLRSLRLLFYFLEAYSLKPQFSMPDMRSLIPRSTSEIKGDPALLQYQSFDGNKQTDIMPLEIGKHNSAASLLARLKHETGFENYQAFFKGQNFLPNGTDVCKSLEELHISEGLILVKRAASDVDLPPRIRPGLSPVEIKVLCHFKEMWEYLSMTDMLAREVYHFLLRVPIDGGTMDLFDDTSRDYAAIFAADQPYKNLYIVHAMLEYTAGISPRSNARGDAPGISESVSSAYSTALARSLDLLVHALEDRKLSTNATESLMTQMSCKLMTTFTRLLNDAHTFWGPISAIQGPSPECMVNILEDALDCATEEATDWVSSTLSAILLLSIRDQSYWSGILENHSVKDLLARVCLFDSRSKIRSIGIGMIEEVASRECQIDDADESSASQHVAQLSKFFWSLSLQILPQALHLGMQCQQLLQLMQTLTVRLTRIHQIPMRLEPFAVRVAELLRQHTVAEEISDMMPCDTVAYGLVSLLDICTQLDRTLPKSLPHALMQSLLETKLFPEYCTKQSSGLPRVILNPETRKKLYELIFQQARHDPPGLQAVLGFLDNLTPFYTQDDEEPYVYDLPFQFDAASALRAPCGYVGLRNLSNTCYLNSLLTQLYMNTEFRQFLLSFEVQHPDGAQNLLFSTQNLFGYLQDSIQRYVDTTPLVKTIKTYDDTVIDIHSQMDVDEFYNLLFDRWEGQLPSGQSRKTLRSFYGGQLVQQVKSKECDHISERLEPFSAIQCDIKGKATLQDSLQAYVDGEIMEGDNKYKCSSCDSHVDAVKRACLKDIPDNVIFHLKRFDFNLRTLQRSKINDYFAFPEIIDLQPYTIDFLSGASGAHDDQDIFELVGVLVHSGTAESGHYYSYIRERPSGDDKRWIEFNDDHVSPWDPAMLEESTFGGIDRSPVYDTNGIAYDKTYSAYMLFYQRSTSLSSQKESLGQSAMQNAVRCQVDSVLEQHIQTENVNLLRRHCLFDQSHSKFVQACIGEATKGLDQMSLETEDEANMSRVSHNLAMNVAMGHLDQIVTRAKDVPHFANFSAYIREQISSCEDCAVSFFMYLVEKPAVFRALVQRNPDRNVRRQCCNLFLESLNTIATKSPEMYCTVKANSPAAGESADEEMELSNGSDDELGDTSILQDAVALLDYLWKHFQVHIKSWDEYFNLILDVAKRGKREVAQLLAGNYLAKCLQIISADAAMDLPSNYVRMLQNIYRRYATQPASYKGVIALIDYLMHQLEPELSEGNIVEDPEDRLKHSEGEFPWTSAEVNLVHHHPERQTASIFVEKLLTIDQAHATTHNILQRIVRTGRLMDAKVFHTLRRVLQGDTTTEPLDPYLRAASIFVNCTDSLHQAQRLISHICAQVSCLQNSEGAAFLSFFEEILNTERDEEDENRVLRWHATGTMPDCAPYLLVYPDETVRRGTERLLEHELLQPLIRDDSDSEDVGLEKDTQLGETALKLGNRCLAYFQDSHIRRRTQIEREAITEMIGIIEKCSQYVDQSETLDTNSKLEYSENRREILVGLRRLIVDEVEEDTSDWEGSTFSSEAMDEAADVGAAPSVEDPKYMDLMQGLSE